MPNPFTPKSASFVQLRHEMDRIGLTNYPPLPVPQPIPTRFISRCTKHGSLMGPTTNHVLNRREIIMAAKMYKC